MSVKAPAAATWPPGQTPPLPAPQTVGEAITSIHVSSNHLVLAAEKLLELAELREQCPDMHTVVINDQNSGLYQVVDRNRYASKSIGVLNPGSAPVYIGIAGQSASAQARVPSCPGASALVLPLEAKDVLIGCDPAALGSNTAVVFVFRYVTVQPLVLRQVP